MSTVEAYTSKVFTSVVVINQSKDLLVGLSSGTTARSTVDSQLMSSIWSGKDFLEWDRVS